MLLQGRPSISSAALISAYHLFPDAKPFASFRAQGLIQRRKWGPPRWVGQLICEPNSPLISRVLRQIRLEQVPAHKLLSGPREFIMEKGMNQARIEGYLGGIYTLTLLVRPASAGRVLLTTARMYR